MLAAALAVSVAAAAVLLLDYRPAAARYAKASTGLRDAASAVQDQRSVVWAALAAPNSGDTGRFAAALARMRRADGAVLRSGAGGTRVLNDLIAVNSAEQAWTEWAAQALQQAQVSPSQSTGGPPAPVTLVRQGETRYATYRDASGRAIADVTRLGAQAVDDERTVVLGWLIVGGALVILAGVLLVWTRRRFAAMTAGAVGSLLDSVRRIEAGEEVELASLDPPVELEELSRLVVGVALELESLRGAMGVSSSRGEERARRLAHVLELTQSITGHLSLPAVLSAVSRAAIEISGAERAVVWVADDDGLHYGTAATAEPGSLGVGRAPGGEGLAGIAAGGGSAGSAGELATEQPSASVSQSAAFGRTVSLAEGRHPQIAVPMTHGGRVLGVIDLRGRELGRATEDDLSVLETLASHGASALTVAREHGVAESMSMTDPLTHLPNRRQLDHDLATECERARRYRRSSALLMLDVDGFKAFNDRHGHLAADQILAEFGRLLSESIRGSDSAYRYGGDEFVVLVREASVAAAADLAERLRQLIAERFSVLPPDAPVTASFGVVGVDQVDPEPATLLRAADEALYSAKERGRNRVVSFR